MYQIRRRAVSFLLPILMAAPVFTDPDFHLLAARIDIAQKIQTQSLSNTIVLKASTTRGNAPLTVRFEAVPKLAKGLTVTRYYWDFDNNGKTDAGFVVPMASYTYLRTGVYTSVVSVILSNGKKLQAGLKITAIPPSSDVYVVSPEAGQTLNGDVPVVVYADSRKIDLHRLELWIYDEFTNAVKMLAEQTVDSLSKDCKYFFMWHTNTQAETGRRYYLFVRAYDMSHNCLGSPTIYVTVHNTPSVQIIFPLNNTRVSGLVDILVEAIPANRAYGLERIELWVMDEATGKNILVQTMSIDVPAADNKYKIRWNTNAQAVDGHKYYAFVKAFDASGNSCVSTSAYVAVSNAPSASIDAPASFTTVFGEVSITVSAGPASPDFPLRKIELYACDVNADITTILESRPVQGGNIEKKYIFTWNTLAQARNNRRYELYAAVSDTAGNTYNSEPIFLMVDNTPGATIIFPKDKYTASGNVEVLVEACSASPLAPVRKIDFYGIDENLNFTILMESRKIAEESADKKYRFIWDTNQKAQNGHRYYLYITVTDSYGNTANSPSVCVWVKNSPCGAVLDPILNDTVSGNVEVKVEAYPASPDFPVCRIELWAADTATNIKKIVAELAVDAPSPNGIYLLYWDTNKTSHSQRRYELYIVIYDSAGNEFTAAPVILRVDNTPSALLIKPVGESTYSGTVEVEVEAYAANPQYPLDKFEIWAHDCVTNHDTLMMTVEVKKEEENGRYKFLWDANLKALSGHKYNIYVRVFDKAGNFTNSNIAVVLINTQSRK
ncbi:MAG: hypothetical protein ACM3WV_01105 [Bacillota bacterium]